MSHLFESIRLINGQIRNLKYHQKRVDRAFDFYQAKNHLDLKTLLKKEDLPRNGLYKVRVSYHINDEKKEVKITPYSSKKIKTLKLVELSSEEYIHKYEDRLFINNHYSEKGSCDDVLFYKENKILDTSYCNIAFYDGKNWLTPKVPMLRGTMRDQLIEKEIIKEKDIFISEIKSYKKARLFNAMILWRDKKDVKAISPAGGG